MKSYATLMLISAAVLWAGEPQINTTLANRTAFLGDPVQFNIQITYDEGWAFDPIELPEDMGGATVLDQNWSEPQIIEGTQLIRTELRAHLAWYKLDEHKVPQLEITGIPPDEEGKLYKTPELTIEIVNMLTEEDQEMAPAKGQVDLKTITPTTLIIIGVVVVILLAIIIFLIVRHLRKRKGQAPGKPAPPPKPAYDEAMERLEQLTHSSMLKEGRYKDFYVEINQIIRHYYARLYHIHAEEMTSFELEDWMHGRTELPDGALDANRNFQDLCDRVKFAKHEPMESENKQTLNQAYEIVALHRPKPSEEVADVAAG